MRITCPNCGALYEIDAALIPAGGREVQCSACATTWFEDGGIRKEGRGGQARTLRRPSGKLSGAADADARDGAKAGRAGDGVAAKTRVGPPPPSEGDGEEQEDGPARENRPGEFVAPKKPVSGRPTERHARPSAAPVGKGAPEDEEDEDDSPDQIPPRPTTDERTLEILREERAREDRMRAEAGGRDGKHPPISAGAASPTDPRAAAAAERERMAAAAATARARRLEASEAAGGSTPRPARPAPGADRSRLARRDLLPDIEEINSSLRPDTDRPDMGRPHRPAGSTRRGSGFGKSFVITVLILLVPLAIYVLAEPIADAVPAAAPMLEAYVGAIDSARIALDRGAGDLADGIAPDR